MNTSTMIIAGLIALICLLILAGPILRKRRGKNSCCGMCGGCPMSGGCHSKQEEQHTRISRKS